ncbi:MAG: ATP-binding cassette domain-containing protein [Xanthomonadales bacterium]|nr:ATP-binding cassette domain-containing protein [Xanthomonadales bacterium]
MSAPVLTVDGLSVDYQVHIGGIFKRQHLTVHALQDVNFELYRGETLGIAGESGSGKSTLARTVLALQPARSGHVVWRGDDLLAMDREVLRAKRKEMQMIFQDPLGSLNPRLSAGEIIAEPLRTHYPRMARLQIHERVIGMMKMVGLSPEHVNRYPHEFSGGQCQRLGIARALVLNPRLLVCDEPVSALDVSIQAQILHLLKDLQKKLQLSMIFIAHDLSLLRYVSNRIMVLYLGQIMEIGDRASLYQAPRHPYTRALIQSVPIPDPERERRDRERGHRGAIPSPFMPPSGCLFHPRCPFAIERCKIERPSLRPVREGHAACHRVEELHLERDIAAPAASGDSDTAEA